MTPGHMLLLDVSGLIAFLALLMSVAVIYDQERHRALVITEAANRAGLLTRRLLIRPPTAP